MKPDIVFYQQYAVPYFGVVSLASHLKHKGFKSDVIIDSLEKFPIKELKQLKPKLIGISVMSPEHKWLIQSTQVIRKALPDTTIIVGGVHSIFYSKEILSDTPVDLVCHSEGEEVILNVIRELDKSAPSWDSIPGLSFKDRIGRIHTNERAMLTPFSDEIIEDRAIYYDRYSLIAKDKGHRFFSARGCPYRCSFCYNGDIHDVFKGKGKYLRRKSINNFIQEITLEYEKYPMESLFFYDDLFTFNKEWLKEFLEIYKEKVNLPFFCTSRANLMDEETARILAEGGCRTASIGIETGNYHIRSNILKKHISDDEIIRCGNLLHKQGIKVQGANMFCLPDETVEDALKTVEINIKSKVDYAFSGLLMPFPNTELADYCIEKALLRPDYSLNDMPSSVFSSILDIPRKKKEVIKNIHRLTYFFVKWPWLFKRFKKIVYLTFLSPIFNYIFLFANVLRYKEEKNISLLAAFQYAWRMRNSL